MPAVRWNVVVSAETDRSVRMHLAQNGGRKGDLSRFIEDAVRKEVFERANAEARAATAGMREDEVDDLIEEALSWARAQK